MSDNKTELTLTFILVIVELVLKHGIPAVVNIIKLWQVKGEPTLEDIRALKTIIKPPELYFE